MNLSRKIKKKLPSIILICCLIIVAYISSQALGIKEIEKVVEYIENQVDTLGIWAPAGIFALRFSSILVPILPGTLYSVLSGYFFGIEKGLLIIFLADITSCSICFYLSRQFGREFIKNLVGYGLMRRVESFANKHVEQNFFLMTGLLMTSFFDFVCYGVGLTKVKWNKFMPALIFSIIISDIPFVAAGEGLKSLKGINIEQIINGEIPLLKGHPLWIFISSVTFIFILALVNILTRKKINLLSNK